MQTLKKFIELHGSQERAAGALGIATRTVHRWITGQSKPSRIMVIHLEREGVRLSK